MEFENFKSCLVLLECKLKIEQLSEKLRQARQEELNAYDRLTYRLQLFEEKYFNNPQFEDAYEEGYGNALSRDELKEDTATVIDLADQDVERIQISIDIHCKTPKPLEVSYVKKVPQERAREIFQLPNLSRKSGSNRSSTINSSEIWEFGSSRKSNQILNSRYVDIISHLKAASDLKVWLRLKWSIFLLLNNLVGRLNYYDFKSFSLITEFCCTSRVLFARLRTLRLLLETLSHSGFPESSSKFKLVDRTE
jgi:hypothetical protein